MEPGHTDRETVDLLFFPTGGGKTEAYLGLAAFIIAPRNAQSGARWSRSDRVVRHTADSDEAARVYRALSAHRSNLMAPTILI